jgi:hypothetical protein
MIAAIANPAATEPARKKAPRLKEPSDINPPFQGE